MTDSTTDCSSVEGNARHRRPGSHWRPVMTPSAFTNLPTICRSSGLHLPSGRAGTPIPMQFCNIAQRRYTEKMTSRPSTAILARLRQSARLAVFMVLVFALKIGAVVTCTVHDMLDPANAANGSPANVAWIDDASDGDRSGNPFDLGGSCEHCGCHQSTAILPTVSMFQPPCSTLAAACFGTAARHVLLPKELRPPIV